MYYKVILLCVVIICGCSSIGNQSDTKVGSPINPVKAVRGNDGIYRIPLSTNSQKHKADTAKKKAEQAKEEYELKSSNNKQNFTEDNISKTIINWNKLVSYYLAIITGLFIYLAIVGRKK